MARFYPCYRQLDLQALGSEEALRTKHICKSERGRRTFQELRRAWTTGHLQLYVDDCWDFEGLDGRSPFITVLYFPPLPKMSSSPYAAQPACKPLFLVDRVNTTSRNVTATVR